MFYATRTDTGSGRLALKMCLLTCQRNGSVVLTTPLFMQ